MLTVIGGTRRGVATVWVALCGVLLFGFLGMGLDVGLMLLTAHQLQNAADASSLAAVQHVGEGSDQVCMAAIAVAEANNAGGVSVQLSSNPDNAPDGDVVIGRYDRSSGLFTVTTESPNAVRVVARRTADSAAGGLGLMFGPAFGVQTVDVERSAIAYTEPAASAAVIVLHGGAQGSLSLDSNARLNVDAAVQVNSTHSQAMLADSNAMIDSPELNVVGGVRFASNSEYVGTDLNTGAPFVPDPLAPLPAPPNGTNRGTIFLDSNQVMTVTTAGGYYPGGISLDSNTSLTLAPGIYVLGGVGLRVNSNAQLHAEGVMFYIADGEFLLDSNGDINVTPPETGPYAGVSVFQARDNTQDAVINSNGNLGLDGTLYFPKATLHIDSNGDAIGSQIIADKLSMDSNGDINVTYKAPGAADALDAYGMVVFLVE